jgi:hypothetical protein
MYSKLFSGLSISSYLQKLKKLNTDIFSVCLFVTIAVFLVVVWFRNGIMLATAEEALPFYSILRTSNLYSSFFYDTGLGLSGVFNISRVPFYFLLLPIQNSGVASWILQAVVFGTLIFTALTSVYFLVKRILGENETRLACIASIFYLCNLFTLSQIWTRFITSLLFLWAYLPLFLFLWISYVNSGKIKYLFFLLVSSILFSNTFVLLSPLITLWICAFIYFVLRLFEKESKKELLIRAIVSFILFIGVNIWWLFPILESQGSLSAVSVDVNQNIHAVEEVSTFFPNSEIFSLRQTYMFGKESPYFDFYNQSTVKSISALVFLITLIGVGVSFRKKQYTFFLVLFFVGWFVVKGTNPPFGHTFYDFIFKYISIFQVYRNPYEKFGVVFVLGYAVLFSVGLLLTSQKWRKLNIAFIITLLFLTCGYLLKPLWNGELFKNTGYVVVPTYYESANQYIIKTSTSEQRLLQLPMLHGSRITYDWNYTGEEPSEFLFDRASVSRTLSNSQIDAFYSLLGAPEFFRNNKYYANILSIMNVKYVVLHKDEIPSVYYQEGINDTRSYIENWNGVSRDRDFDKLEVFKVKSDSDNRIYLSSSIIGASNLHEAFEKIMSPDFKPNNDAILIKSQNENIELQTDNLQVPHYEIQQISKSEYSIHVHESQKPFVLILSDNFSPSWVAKVDDELQEKHFMVNGFANGWFIDKKGDYTVNIGFKILPWN